jgi:hypothetical protein
MGRALGVAFAGLVLAGCLEGAHGLEVANGGSSDVRVRVVYDERVEDDWGGRFETRIDETYVAPGETARLWFPDEPLHVRIERAADGAVLYEEYLTDGEFEQENGRVEIAVYP